MASFESGAGWRDGVAARVWRAGGPTALAWGEALFVLIWWTVVGFGVLLGVWLAARWIARVRVRWLVCGLAAVGVVGSGVPDTWRWIQRKNASVSDIRLLVASELADAAKSLPRGALFANPTALSQLVLFAPEGGGGVSPQAAAALSLNPSAWRKTLRKAGWTAVALSGPIGEFRPLLEYLLHAPDWRLSLVTNQGYFFVREPGAPVPSLDLKTFHLRNDRETAIYLAQIAERYEAIGRPGDGLAALNRALELAPDDPTVLSHAATFAAGRKRWQDAIAYSGRALTADPGSNHARLVRALAFLESGDAGGAQTLCEQVLSEAPNDLYTLFLYARICRELHDATLEAVTLEKVIALSQAAGLETLHYRIYLGQAYARLGQPEPALKNYRMVLESGGLSPDQAGEIRDAISAIEQNAPKE
jgi:tetratricopeptide (TPR) repeat protein